MRKTREMKDVSNDAQRAKELQERLNEVLRANEELVYRNKKQEQSINAYKAANTKYRKLIDEQIADAASREKKFVEQGQEALRELQIEFEKVKNQYYDAIEQYNNCKKRYDALLNMPWYKRIFIKE